MVEVVAYLRARFKSYVGAKERSYLAVRRMEQEVELKFKKLDTGRDLNLISAHVDSLS